MFPLAAQPGGRLNSPSKCAKNNCGYFQRQPVLSASPVKQAAQKSALAVMMSRPSALRRGERSLIRCMCAPCRGRVRSFAYVTHLHGGLGLIFQFIFISLDFADTRTLYVETRLVFLLMCPLEYDHRESTTAVWPHVDLGATGPGVGNPNCPLVDISTEL